MDYAASTYALSNLIQKKTSPIITNVTKKYLIKIKEIQNQKRINAPELPL